MSVWIVVVLFLIQAPDGSVSYLESRPPMTFASRKECVVTAGAAAAVAVNDSENQRIIGYTVACSREEEV